MLDFLVILHENFSCPTINFVAIDYKGFRLTKLLMIVKFFKSCRHGFENVNSEQSAARLVRFIKNLCV